MIQFTQLLYNNSKFAIFFMLSQNNFKLVRSGVLRKCTRNVSNILFKEFNEEAIKC